MHTIDISQPQKAGLKLGAAEKLHTLRVILLIALLFIFGLITCLPASF